MKIVIAGASGLIGKALSKHLKTKGHEITPLSRKEGKFHWNPEKEEVDLSLLEEKDVIINVSGENISSGRWTANKKERILSSRLNASTLLRQAIKKLNHPPKVFINASAIGFYGSTGDLVVDEETPPGEDFLADVCKQWEAAVFPVEKLPVRIVIPRIGMVVSRDGGVLEKVKLPFSLGLGGVIGSGQQYMSWIDLQDVCQIFEFLIQTETLFGPVNLVSPNPVTNREWTESLGKILHRPTFFSIPETLAKIVFGEMADSLLLSSTKVYPKALLDSGYVFSRPLLEDSLKAQLTD